ncbi:DUF2164 family protein [Halomonas binhaiensis]|uniref:DUF2164 family protein n=1 Tax=Halomonas binhaiensis TaxID=2562282 RepID=A0A5C1NGA5_9GAMM|nr:DUF2164 family protein [Halomonas binhaiensis]QEM81245.1 DUF2164 family protein [Halomonas binhaiensis]
MSEETFDLVKFSSEVKELLLSELDVSVGNMEVIEFSEKLYGMIRARAFNEGLLAAKDVLEKKMEDISEQLDFLVKDEN